MLQVQGSGSHSKRAEELKWGSSSSFRGGVSLEILHYTQLSAFSVDKIVQNSTADPGDVYIYELVYNGHNLTDLWASSIDWFKIARLDKNFMMQFCCTGCCSQPCLLPVSGQPVLRDQPISGLGVQPGARRLGLRKVLMIGGSCHSARQLNGGFILLGWVFFVLNFPSVGIGMQENMPMDLICNKLQKTRAVSN